MSIKKIFNKLTSRILWVNFLLMFLFIIGLAIGLWITLDRYTLHGIEKEVPNVKGMRIIDARKALEKQGLVAIVSDSGYNKTLPAGTVLDQKPGNGRHVKPGREIYLTTNTTQTPTLQMPDIADNSSLREAEARITAMGLKLTPPEYVSGERDWVYGVKYRGRNIFHGDPVPIDATLTLQVGCGTFMEDSISAGPQTTEEELFTEDLETTDLF